MYAHADHRSASAVQWVQLQVLIGTVAVSSAGDHRYSCSSAGAHHHDEQY